MLHFHLQHCGKRFGRQPHLKRHVNGVHRGIVSTNSSSNTLDLQSSVIGERKSENRPKSRHKSNHGTSPNVSLESDDAQTDHGNIEMSDMRDETCYFEPITFQETLTSVESNVLLINEESEDVFSSSLAFEDNLAKKGPHSIEMLTTPLMGLDEENNSIE